jgi:hypothetical protein
VNVAVGDFQTATATTGGTTVTTGVLPGADESADQLAADTVQAIKLLEERFGDFPFPTLTVPLVAAHGGGEEYSSSILLGDDDFGLLVHETAHMWFFAMVGNSQFRDPWLDEAFATYAESVASDGDRHRHRDALGTGGSVGGAMTEFAGQGDYEHRVYRKGAAALEAARDAAGATAFDAAVRCYVDRQAWTVARPRDLAVALADLPAAVDVLVKAGALTRQDAAAVGD